MISLDRRIGKEVFLKHVYPCFDKAEKRAITLSSIEKASAISYAVLHDKKITWAQWQSYRSLTGRFLPKQICNQVTDLDFRFSDMNFWKLRRTLTHFPNAKKINLNFCANLTDRALPYLQHFDTVLLAGCKRLTNRGLTHLKECTTVDLSFTYRISYDGLKELTSCRHLTMAGSAILDDDLLAIPQLTSLNLRRCWRITDLVCSYVQNCQDLDVSHTNISRTGLAQMAHLHSLNLQGCTQILTNPYVVTNDLRYIEHHYHQLDSIVLPNGKKMDRAQFAHYLNEHANKAWYQLLLSSQSALATLWKHKGPIAMSLLTLLCVGIGKRILGNPWVDPRFAGLNFPRPLA